jgi:GntR family transcriptional regulator
MMKKTGNQSVDRSLPIPLYYQIAERIVEQIRANQLKPGDQIPSERDLSVTFGVSRMTARQAVNYLVQQKSLTVRHGHGTFVAEPKLTYNAPHLLSFTEAMLLAGKVATSSVLEQKRVAAPDWIMQRLDLTGSDEIVQVTRVRYMDGIPLVIETVAVPADRCPGLENADLNTQSLYTILEQRYGLPLDRASQTLAARVAGDFEAKWLEIEPGAPVITLEGITLLESGEPIEHFTAHYRGDRFAFAFESTREVFHASDMAFEMVLDNQRLSTIG